MNASRFNIYVKLNDEEHAIVHGYTKAIDVVPSPIAEKILKNDLNKFEEEELSYMEERGYITDMAKEEEYEKFYKFIDELHEIKLQNTPYSMVILPTYNCNLRCIYCFENPDKKRRVATISDDLIDKAFDIYLKNIESIEKAIKKEIPKALTLYGGEPLFSQTKNAIEKIIRKAKQHNITVSAVTNGVELDLFEDLLGDDGISKIQVSLDGPPHVHDKTRCHADGKSTFFKIADNIEMAARNGVNVALRVNIGKDNISDLEELDKFFISRGWDKNPLIKPYPGKIQAAKDVHQKDVLTFNELDNFLREKSFCVPPTSSGILHQFMDIFDGNNHGSLKTGFCGANYNMLLFDALGDLYKCWEYVGNDDYIVGKYDEGEIKSTGNIIEFWKEPLLKTKSVTKKNAST